MKNRTSLYIYPTPLLNESRLVKMARSLLKSEIADEVQIVGVKKNRLPGKEKVEGGLVLIRLWRPSESHFLVFRLLSFFIWSCGLIIYVSRKSFVSIHAHSLSVLPISALISKFKGADLIYEPHEYEIGVENKRRVRSYLRKLTERIFLPLTSGVVVASPLIAQAYVSDYRNLIPKIILNIPDISSESMEKIEIRRKFGISTEAILFVYQGILDENRGIAELCESFANRDGKEIPHLLIIGEGPDTERVYKYTMRNRNIHYLPFQSQDKLRKVNQQCDVGIVPLKEGPMNHELALPNKLFEYLHADLPILASNRLQLRKFVEELGIGMLYEDGQIQEKIALLQKSKIEEHKSRVKVAKGKFQWRNEERELMSFYQQTIRIGRLTSDG